MRRLLFSVSLVAALFVAPSAAFATGKAAITAPASGVATNVMPITLTWTDVGVPLVPVTYRVLRFDAGSNPCPTDPPGSAGNVSGDMIDTFTYLDPVTTQGPYCYWVEATDGLTGTSDSDPVLVTLDTSLPAVPTVTLAGGNGCSPFTLSNPVAVDNLTAVTFTVDTAAFPPAYTPLGNPYEQVNPTVVATDAAGNFSTAIFPGRVEDPTGPGPVTLEVSTDPAQQKATLNWDQLPLDGAPVTYHLRTKGPQGVGDSSGLAGGPLDVPNLQVDATYEFTLNAVDACLRAGASSVKLVRLNDTDPPTTPIVANPTFNPATHVVTLSWVPSTDNIQVDHYEILRNGVPLGATDATTFVDAAPAQHADLSYVVRAVDTNGNSTDSAPAPISTPDWTPPTAPVPILSVEGTTVTVRWAPAVDNVGVVGYDVVRDDRVRASMTAAVRTYKDIGVPPGLHTWRVVARDDAQLTAVSAPIARKIVKPAARASLVALKMAGGSGRGAARYSLSGPARLLLDMRIVGTLAKAKLRLYVASGHGRITVWRGTPGSSAPRLRLHSSLARQGYVTIKLGRTLHAGRIRLVLIASGRLVIVGAGKHKPSMSAG